MAPQQMPFSVTAIVPFPRPVAGQNRVTVDGRVSLGFSQRLDADVRRRVA